MSLEDLRKYLVFKDTEFGCGEGWEAILDDLGLDLSRLAAPACVPITTQPERTYGKLGPVDQTA